MRVGRGLLAAGVVLVSFVAGYLVGRGQSPRIRPRFPMLADTALACPPLQLDSFDPEQVPVFTDTMDRLLADLDRRMAELRTRPGTEPANLEHAYRYYGQVQEGLRRLNTITDLDSIAAVRRQVVVSYRAALKVLTVAAALDSSGY